MEMPVSTIMTSPAISAEEDTPVTDLCRIMWSLRIHRVPILRKGKVTGRSPPWTCAAPSSKARSESNRTG